LLEEFLGTTEEAAPAIKEAARLDPNNDDAKRRCDQ
jgi:hypothetical protein